MNGLCNVLVFKCDVNTANKAQRTHGEGKPPTDRREVTDGSPINSAALSLPPDMTTYYCHTLEEALKRAKVAGKRPGCFYGGITVKSGKKGFAIYREGKVVEQYSVIGNWKTGRM